MICKKPDRDVPKLVCGHPLPCPYHTAIIDPPFIILPEQKMSIELKEKLNTIMEAIDP